MTPYITIVIPCYKVGNYLSQTLQSALAQTHRNIQIIAVDDCSPDDTAQIIRQFAAQDSRLQGIFLDQNSGVSVARNAGLDSAKAPWIIFADGDDWLPANAVESLLKIQNRTKAQFVCANARQYTDAGKAGDIHFRRQTGLHQFSTRDSLDEFWPHQDVFCTCWAKLFSTVTLRDKGLRFDSALRHAQDTLFTLTYLLSVRPTVAIDYDTEVYCYRQNPDSCVHAIPLAKRLNNLERLIVALDDLALRTQQSRRLVAPKSAEYLWAIRKFAANAEDCKQHAKALISSALFREHLFPVLRQYGKFKHRILSRLLAAGHAEVLRFW